MKERITDTADALLFDMDGTVIDSMWIWKQIDIEYLGDDAEEEIVKFQQEIEGMSFTETAFYMQKRFALPDTVEQIKAQLNAMAADFYTHRVVPKPGALHFLEEMKRQGKKMAIATSNSRQLAEASLQGCGLEHYFDVILTACEVEKGKPAPDIYLEAARRLGVEVERCLVFEDVPMGILAGKNAGMRVCAMEDVYSSAQEEKIRSLADYYIRDYGEVLSGTQEVLA